MLLTNNLPIMPTTSRLVQAYLQPREQSDFKKINTCSNEIGSPGKKSKCLNYKGNHRVWDFPKTCNVSTSDY